MKITVRDTYKNDLLQKFQHQKIRNAGGGTLCNVTRFGQSGVNVYDMCIGWEPHCPGIMCPQCKSDQQVHSHEATGGKGVYFCLKCAKDFEYNKPPGQTDAPPCPKCKSNGVVKPANQRRFWWHCGSCDYGFTPRGKTAILCPACKTETVTHNTAKCSAIDPVYHCATCDEKWWYEEDFQKAIGEAPKQEHRPAGDYTFNPYLNRGELRNITTNPWDASTRWFTVYTLGGKPPETKQPFAR